VIVFLALNSNKNLTDATAMKFGFIGAMEIFEGRWYSLITSAFVHIEMTHIFFNMYWLWILGPVVERQMGPLKFAGFIIITAIISSGWQLATGHTGIGFSGVGYAIIGYGWIARIRIPGLSRYFTNQTLQIFAGWAVICVFLDLFHVSNIGNVAHISGAAAGALITLAFIQRRWYAYVALPFMTGLAFVPVYWNPRSPEWNFHKGIVAHDKKDYDAAIRYYQRSAELDPELWESWYNIALMDAGRQDTAKFMEALAKVRKLKPAEADKLESEVLGISKPKVGN
jgi:GlpG protein